MNKTKKLTDGAMMVALIGVLLFINRQSAGFIDFAIYWIVPIPIIIYTMRGQRQRPILNALSSLMFISILILLIIINKINCFLY